MSLVARELEGHNIPTVIIGSALDIVEHCGVPRFLFTDFPLGNPAGPPYEVDLQLRIAREAIILLSSAKGPRTTVAANVPWTGDPNWRPRYGRVSKANRIELAALGEARRQQQLAAKN